MAKYAKLTDTQVKQLENLVQRNTSVKEVKRAQAVLMLDKGVDMSLTKSITGLSERRVYTCRQLFFNGGVKAIEEKRAQKTRELLSKKQRTEIIDILANKSPGDFDYESDFWTTSILVNLVKEKYNIQYKSKSSYYALFRESKFSYHLPGKVYEGRDQDSVDAWKRKHKAEIRQATIDPGAVVLAEDEMVLSTQTTTQKVWLPRGHYPKIEVATKRANRSFYGFLNLKTGKAYAYKTFRQNSAVTIECLKEIRKVYPDKRILLLWDSARWHTSKEVQEFITQDKRIDIIHFPKYAPDTNPQEHVWKQGRSNTTHNITIKNIDETADKFIEYITNNTFNYKLFTN